MHLPRTIAATLAISLAIPAAFLALGASPASAAPVGSSIAKLALANVGDHACSRNSLGGTAFDSSCTGNNGQPEYWCADFARWVWGSSGVLDTGALTAAAGSFYLYGLDYGTLTSTPAVGDAAVFNYYGGGDAEHVALVTSVSTNGTIETVSGDWGGDSGSEARFASTSTVVLNSPAYQGVLGSVPDEMGMTLSAFVAPVGVHVVPIEGRTVLKKGDTLVSGETMTSPNGLYQLKMVSDGDLAEYAGGREVWSTGTGTSHGATATMEDDGDFAIYSTSHKLLWSTKTGGHTSGHFSLALENNGLLTVQGITGTTWSERPGPEVLNRKHGLGEGQRLVSTNGVYTLDMQSDGNLVEYTAGRALWGTNTAGDKGAKVTFEPDGDLVVYSPSGKTLWSSGHHDVAGVRLILENDAALVIAAGSRVLWSNPE